jgi:hypothetical protein
MVRKNKLKVLYRESPLVIPVPAIYNEPVMKTQIRSKPYEELTEEEKKTLHDRYDGCCKVVKSAYNWIENFEQEMKKQQ